MRYQLTIVDWIDASTHDSWQTLDDAKTQHDYVVSTVGWCVSDTKRYITLATGVSNSGQAAATWRIPKGMIVKRKNIKGNDLVHS